jgi:2-methylcitrate dehydratase PrpD
MSGQSPLSWIGAERLAAHAVETQFAELPAFARAAVRAFVLDTVGVGVGGAASLYAPKVRALAGAWGKGGGQPIFGSGQAPVPAAHAAFVNAFFAHSQEFDCVHEAAVLHPFTVVTPVLLAEAADRGMSGQIFITACAIGVDVAAGLGVAATSQIRFFRPATCGLFGATAALAHARGLSQAQTIDALGYALAFASGTMQAHVEGTPALAMAVANAARNAFAAVDIAQAGLPGPRGSIDGPFGYLSLFELSHALAPVLDGLGKTWRAAEVSWKPFPTGRAAHGGIGMMQDLLAQGLDPADVRHIRIEATPLITHLVGRPIITPLEVNYARLCLPYCAAVALRAGGVGLADFTTEKLNDPDTHALAQKIDVIRIDNGDPAAFTPQRALATLNDGRMLEAGVTVLLGAPRRPLTREQHLTKFRACMAFVFGSPRPALDDALIAQVDELETCADVGHIARLAAGMDGA